MLVDLFDQVKFEGSFLDIYSNSYGDTIDVWDLQIKDIIVSSNNILLIGTDDCEYYLDTDNEVISYHVNGKPGKNSSIEILDSYFTCPDEYFNLSINHSVYGDICEISIKREPTGKSTIGFFKKVF